jgi:hypothetical protein
MYVCRRIRVVKRLCAVASDPSRIRASDPPLFTRSRVPTRVCDTHTIQPPTLQKAGPAPHNNTVDSACRTHLFRFSARERLVGNVRLSKRARVKKPNHLKIAARRVPVYMTARLQLRPPPSSKPIFKINFEKTVCLVVISQGGDDVKG